MAPRRRSLPLSPGRRAVSQDLRGPAVGYLVSHYPAWYAPYIASEIALLRHHGVAVHVVSLGHPDPGPGGRDDDGVYHVAALSRRAHVRAHLRALRARPAAYARGLLAALRAG